MVNNDIHTYKSSYLRQSKFVSIGYLNFLIGDFSDLILHWLLEFPND